MATQYFCKNKGRRQAVANKPGLNGIDYLEVSPDQTILKVHFFHDLAMSPVITRDNVIIMGGVRVKGATLESVGSAGEGAVIEGDIHVESATSADRVLTVTVDTPGDFSTYTLRLIRSLINLLPPSGFDMQLSEVDFSFKVECPSDFDCAPQVVCPPEKLPEPEINYLAKDYISFRRLMLDRLSVIMPDWRERNPADVEVTLVELLAYVGDHLSYYQDAVAMEAYLGKARLRTSVRRHARLLDYFMHDGSNARTWVCFKWEPGDGPDVTLPEGTPLLTKGTVEAARVDPNDLPRVLSTETPDVFETLHSVTLYKARNEIRFYTWGDSECCLPRGATRATLLKKPDSSIPELSLARGDVLVFEEVLGVTSGKPEDADPTHRHAVRLTSVDATAEDPLTYLPTPLIEIEWGEEDALPFSLCLSAVIDGGQELQNVSLARGNVALADHGRRISDEEMETIPVGKAYRPKLKLGPLTQQGHVCQQDSKKAEKLMPFDPKASASSAMRWDMRDVRPWVKLQGGGKEWTPRRDLLSSSRFAEDFVVEVESDGSAYLRFGDSVLGIRPPAGLTFRATYRVGNGAAGNVSSEAICRVVTADTRIMQVWNPLPATGGNDPESLEQTRQFAPQAFRIQERAVTEADYAEVAERRRDVQRGAAALRWTGSWYTAFVTIDRRGGRPVDTKFEQDMLVYLNRYRLAGYDLEIMSPVFVPLDIVLEIYVKSGYFRSYAKEALLRTFSSQDLPSGQRGFFHPDNFTFGQSLYLSQVYKAAMEVAGVDSVDVKKFQRWGKDPNQEKEKGLLTTRVFEVIRLDNDSNFPENGRIDFIIEGGL